MSFCKNLSTSLFAPPVVMIDTWNDFEEGTDVEFGIGERVYLPLVVRE